MLRNYKCVLALHTVIEYIYIYNKTIYKYVQAISKSSPPLLSASFSRFGRWSSTVLCCTNLCTRQIHHLKWYNGWGCSVLHLGSILNDQTFSIILQVQTLILLPEGESFVAATDSNCCICDLQQKWVIGGHIRIRIAPILSPRILGRLGAVALDNCIPTDMYSFNGLWHKTNLESPTWASANNCKGGTGIQGIHQNDFQFNCQVCLNCVFSCA